MEALIEQNETTIVVICFRHSTPIHSVIHWMSSGNEGALRSNQTRATSTVICVYILWQRLLFMQPDRTTLVAWLQRYFRFFNPHIIYIVPAKTLMQSKRMSPLWHGYQRQCQRLYINGSLLWRNI